MICPFRIERKASLLVNNEFRDYFCLCIKESCPCYTVNGKEKWCCRDQIRLPLNESAREGMNYDKRETSVQKET